MMLTTIVLTLAVAGVSPADDQFAAAQAAVADQMRNPEGTHFRNVRAGRSMFTETAICGEFNATNGYGAYVGYRPFYFMHGKAVLEGSDTAAQLDPGYMTNCS